MRKRRPQCKNKGPAQRRGQGWTVNKRGYVRITRGEYRHWYLHRKKAKDCMEASGLKLTEDMRVNHLCGNPSCDCPDFHLLILPERMVAHLDNGKGRPSKGRKNYVPMRPTDDDLPANGSAMGEESYAGVGDRGARGSAQIGHE
jgi:hypothetical protein